MKINAVLAALAVVMVTVFTGCDDDDVNFFGTTDGGSFLFFFSFGDTVNMKPVNEAGATVTQSTVQGQSKDAETTDQTVPNTTTGTYQRATYTFEMPGYPTSFDSVATPRSPEAPTSTKDTNEQPEPAESTPEKPSQQP